MTAKTVRGTSLTALAMASALLLGGCGSDSADDSGSQTSATAATTTTDSATTTGAGTSPSGTAASTAVGKQQAEQIALATVPGGTVVSSEEVKRDGKTVWHVHIRDGRGWDYDVNVDAANGTVVSEDQDRDNDDTRTTPTVPAAPQPVTQQQAEQTALATVPGGTVASSEEQQRDGKTVWHVHIRDGRGWDYDVNVDAATGVVVPDN
ncbi:PepSY domain-containing protein [Rhodococcus oxybenzonivorans]|uniref:PepSY domain-containing protein n=1 Tax=Rhodococcus oxybenzonivorans TaxID=1990687 RepID=UPI0029553BF3|nr:PepSY domain-containing protein [Rhodococcus oxybenzonivorans]MDV7356945.1 PepSY domain-containing protein [Rhodococcus oxybenzonivorans]